MQRGQRYDICPKARRYSTKNGKRGANSCFNKDHILDLSNKVLYVPESQGATKLLVIRFWSVYIEIGSTKTSTTHKFEASWDSGMSIT